MKQEKRTTKWTKFAHSLKLGVAAFAAAALFPISAMAVQKIPETVQEAPETVQEDSETVQEEILEEDFSVSSDDAAGATAFDAAVDMTVEKGTENIPISFTINADSVSEETLKEQGYTVENGKAAKTVECETATYTFTRLPSTLDELKTIPLDDKFGPMAASICAVAAWQDSSMYSSYNHPIFEMFDYLNGESDISNATKSGIFYSMKEALKTGKLAYFEGANPDNEYTPDKPYTFKLLHGPYYIPASDTSIAYGSTPERHMILISFAGDDSQRYIDVYQAADEKWYSYRDQFTHLVAGMRPLTSPIWSTDPVADGTLVPDKDTLNFDFAKDATVTEGSKDIYIEFQINTSTTSKEELEAEGYTVEGGVASKITKCDTKTYTFNKLPTNLNDLLTIPMDNKFGPMAAGICALATYEELSGAQMM
ncbi:MAG: hypothetical protein IJU50_00215, partial [Lachnospiraceae bacterium]|nr:hypothetical protein [Lachnospiraceae bacterium]